MTGMKIITFQSYEGHENKMRCLIKQEEEANSILNQIAESSDRMADGLSDFLGNAFAAGGLLVLFFFGSYSGLGSSL